MEISYYNIEMKAFQNRVKGLFGSAHWKKAKTGIFSESAQSGRTLFVARQTMASFQVSENYSIGRLHQGENMNFWEICGLAILQGLTEFLPVSSSGHLLLLQYFAGIKSNPGPALELALHGGTLFSILFFYRKKLFALLMGVIRREKASLLYCACLIVSCIPAALVYLLFRQQLDAMFENPLACSVMLMITGVLLLSTRFLSLPSRDGDPKWWQAFGIGLIQTVALLPGISRSGSTITAGRWFGISAWKAAEFSFLMSIPLLAGGILLKGKEILALSDSPEKAAILLTGCALAAMVGWFALKLLALFQLSGKFWYFGCYCLFLGTSALLFILQR